MGRRRMTSPPARGAGSRRPCQIRPQCWLAEFEVQPEGPRRFLCVSGLNLGNSRIGGIDDESDDGRLGQQLVHQLQPFRPDFQVQLSRAGHVAAGPRQAGDKAEADRVAAGGEDNRDRRGGHFAASAAGVLVAAMTVTCRRVKSAANSGSRS